MGLVVVPFVAAGALLWYAGTESAAQTFWTLAAASPFMLFLWLMRRACYATSKVETAAYSGLMYGLLLIGHLFLLYHANWISMFSIFAIMGSAGFFTAIWISVQLQAPWPRSTSTDFLGHVVTDHWLYGKWTIMTAMLMWIPSQVFYVLLPIWFGLEDSAGLRALTNLIMPYVLVSSALGTVLIPSFVRVKDQPDFFNLLKQYLYLLVGFGFAYWLAIGLVSPRLIAWLYGGLYHQYAYLMWILGGLPVCSGVIAVFGAILRSLEQPALVFWAYAGSTIVALTIGLIFSAAWGITGAVWGLTISYVTTAVLMLGLYAKVIVNRDSSQDREPVFV
jgi:O-antigen/teichoic acid export membrane protein